MHHTAIYLNIYHVKIYILTSFPITLLYMAKYITVTINMCSSLVTESIDPLHTSHGIDDGHIEHVQ